MKDRTIENSPLEMYPDLLQVPDVSHLLGISPRTVYRLAESGELPRVKIGRRWYFPRARLAALLDACDMSVCEEIQSGSQSCES